MDNTYMTVFDSFTGALMIAYWVICLALSALSLVSLWKIYAKAGRPGWTVLIPFYSIYVLFAITWGNGWKALLLLIPVVNLVVGIMTYGKLAKVFGKNIGFAVGLLCAGFVFLPILAFGSARYLGLSHEEE